MSTRVYPSFRYHKELQPKVVHNDDQHELLESEGWQDSPAAFEEPKAETENPEADLDRRLKELGPEEPQPEDVQDSPAEEELDVEEMKSELMSRGFSKKEVKNKSADELKAMLAE